MVDNNAFLPLPLPHMHKKRLSMKKTILSILTGFALFSTVHAQQTVVIERPGIFTDLATALIEVPASAAVGIVEGTVEAVRDVVTGRTTIVTTPAPIIVRQPVVTAPVVVPQRQVVVTSPLVTESPSTTVVTTTSAPVTVAPQVVIQPQPQTSIVTSYDNGTTVTVTRPASAYELGSTVIIPVAPNHRVGPSPFVNPYVYRHR